MKHHKNPIKNDRTLIKRFSILGIQLSITNLDEIYIILTDERPEKSKYILFPDLSVLSDAAQSKKLKKIINEAFLVMPDGKPSEFIAKIKGLSEVSTVSGYKLILKLLNESSKTHYFYGSTSEKLSKMEAFLSQYDPDGTKILGYKSPPFLRLDEIFSSDEIREDLKKINELHPDFIWIGLSSPKQDYLLYHHHEVVDKGYLMGVGGVFDYLSGDVKISPEWIKKIGLRWLYRLIKEPVRLAPKYSKIVVNLSRYYFKQNSIE